MRGKICTAMADEDAGNGRVILHATLHSVSNNEQKKEREITRLGEHMLLLFTLTPTNICFAK